MFNQRSRETNTKNLAGVVNLEKKNMGDSTGIHNDVLQLECDIFKENYWLPVLGYQCLHF